MPGLNDSTLVHGVLDLIDSRLKAFSRQEPHEHQDDWEGTPNVYLYREHPLDDWVLTSAQLDYPSGGQIHITLNRGLTDEEIEMAIANNKQEAYTPYVDLDAPDDDDEMLPEYNKLSAEVQSPELISPHILEPVGFGTYSIEPTIPEEVDGPEHYDYEYYKEWRLRNVIIEKYDAHNRPVERLILHMVYDTESRLTASMAEIDLEWEALN